MCNKSEIRLILFEKCGHVYYFLSLTLFFFEEAYTTLSLLLHPGGLEVGGCHVVYALSMYALAHLLGIRKRTVPNVARPSSRRTTFAPLIIRIFWWLGHPSPHVEVQ